MTAASSTQHAHLRHAHGREAYHGWHNVHSAEVQKELSSLDTELLTVIRDVHASFHQLRCDVLAHRTQRLKQSILQLQERIPRLHERERRQSRRNHSARSYAVTSTLDCTRAMWSQSCQCAPDNQHTRRGQCRTHEQLSPVCAIKLAPSGVLQAVPAGLVETRRLTVGGPSVPSLGCVSCQAVAGGSRQRCSTSGTPCIGSDARSSSSMALTSQLAASLSRLIVTGRMAWAASPGLNAASPEPLWPR
jgi:hypothetical protein